MASGTSGSWLRESDRETKIRRQEREVGREASASISVSTAARGIVEAALALLPYAIKKKSIRKSCTYKLACTLWKGNYEGIVSDIFLPRFARS